MLKLLKYSECLEYIKKWLLQMTKLGMRRIVITIFSFFLDVVASGVYARQLILPSLINFCILSWIPRTLTVYLFSGTLCLFASIINGYSILSELFFLCFVAVSIAMLKRLLADSEYVILATTCLFCGLHSYLIGDMWFWTVFGIIANILIAISILYYQEVR